MPVSAAAARRFLVRRHLLAPPRSLPAGPRRRARRLRAPRLDPVRPARGGRPQPRPRAARPRPRLRPGLDERAALRAARALRDLQQDAQPAAHRGAALVPPGLGPLPGRAPATAPSRAIPRPSSTSSSASAREGPLSSLDFERRATIDWYWGPDQRGARRPGGALGGGRHRPRPPRGQPPLLRPRRAALPGRAAGAAARRARAAAPQAAVALPRPRPARRGRPVGALVRHRQGPPRRRTTRPDADHRAGAARGARRRRRARARGRRGRARHAATCSATELDLLRGGRGGGRGRHAARRPRRRPSWRRSTRSSGTATCCAASSASTTSGRSTCPQAKRRWGYYVLPILFGDRLVGRIEPRIDRAAGTVRILGLWWEPGFRPRDEEGFVPAMRSAPGRLPALRRRQPPRVGRAPGAGAPPRRRPAASVRTSTGATSAAGCAAGAT